MTKLVLVVFALLIFVSNSVAGDFKGADQYKKIGSKSDPIDYLDFVKRPDFYAGQEVSFGGKITDIFEHEGLTFIQVYVDQASDVVVVIYDGHVDLSKDDTTEIFGMVVKSIEGDNTNGVMSRWPAISADRVAPH